MIIPYVRFYNLKEQNSFDFLGSRTYNNNGYPGMRNWVFVWLDNSGEIFCFNLKYFFKIWKCYVRNRLICKSFFTCFIVLIKKTNRTQLTDVKRSTKLHQFMNKIFCFVFIHNVKWTRLLLYNKVILNYVQVQADGFGPKSIFVLFLFFQEKNCWRLFVL